MDRDIIASYENLYEAYKAAKKGSNCSQDSAKFQVMALEGIQNLRKLLIDQTYQMDEYKRFMIYEPKERLIETCSFKDKVVQHSLSDNILHPRLADVFIRTNYAGQIGKGTDFARDCLKEQMLEFYDKHGLDGWILKCDIEKFYYSIDHEVLKDIVDYYFEDDFTRWLNHLIIDSTKNPGSPLGNQAVQVYALMLLNPVDHMVTGDLGVDLYGRYTDDFYLICFEKLYLEYCLKSIENMIDSLKLKLNGKTQIVPFKNGISFLGFHHYVTEDGTYIRKLSGNKKREVKKRFRRMAELVRNGKMTEEKFYEKYEGWKNHAMKGNCIKLCHSMDVFVEKELRK